MSKTTKIPFPDEIAHLEKINCDIEEAFESAKTRVKRLDKEYTDMKHYMSAYRGEIDPHEMFQNELSLRQIDHTGAFAADSLDKIVKLKDSPYFARIDFRCDVQVDDITYSHLDADGITDSENVFYIGRFTFSHEGKLLISDWRSPVASMFYDYEVGPAHYIAPAGKIDGELTRKRQFKIKNGIMQYALESSMNIQDNVLQQELSHTSDEKMKSIIATIQKEQNVIIRNVEADTLIIQGVAGSGKTSIALHRIAFLLYRFKDRLTAKNVTILSPNKVFGDYISNVLPELGEEPIYEISLADIANVQLENVIEFEADKDPLESHDAAWQERVRFKSTLDFVEMLDEFIRQIPDTIFKPADYSCGRFLASAAMIEERFRAYGAYPIKQRLKMIADDIYDRFDTDNFMEEDIPKSRTIFKELCKMLTVKSTLALYKEFYKQNGITKMFVNAAKNTLEWADVYPVLYIHATFNGLKESSIIKHLVIDEMQDYTPVQYAVLNVLFKCQKTILGDFGQFLNPNHLHTLEDLKQLYSEAEYAALAKSYRSTYEIISFAKRLGNVDTIDAVERHGDTPVLISCYDKQDELRHIREMIDVFACGSYASLGIITKTNEEAKQLHDLLSADYDVHLILPDSTHFVSGMTVTSIQMAKGLEFDEVIITDVDSKKYNTEYDGRLLYIACTRAMHRLTLLWKGDVSRLINMSLSV